MASYLRKFRKVEYFLKEIRFQFIDALRGIAALGVCFHHLLDSNTVLEASLRRHVPSIIQEVVSWGAYGVEVFFVISGFVITYSLRNVPITFSALGRFALRRQLRLDPPYWTVLALALVLSCIEIHFLPHSSDVLPNVSEVVANVVYLQEILQIKAIVHVAWTLCLEVQFYLIMIAVVVIGGWLGIAFRADRRPFAAVLTAILGVLSLLVYDERSPWFLSFWCHFAAGALAFWAMENGSARWVAFSYFGIFLLFCIQDGVPRMMAGLVSALIVLGLSRGDRLKSWSLGWGVQYFGRISYSLYLVHFSVLEFIMRGAYKVTGENQWAAVFWVILAFGISVVVAHLLYVTVERWGMSLSSQFKQVRKRQIIPAIVEIAD